MHLMTVTLTGADDRTDPKDLIALSREFPFVEWGILFSQAHQGTGRYPSAAWIDKLCDLVLRLPEAERPAFAAHLCGKTMRDCVTFGEDWLHPHQLLHIRFHLVFGRTQLNFSLGREKFTADDVARRVRLWPQGKVITQEHGGNAGLTAVLAEEGTRSAQMRSKHQVLHDASGGRGVAPDHWPAPIPGVTTGFAGGIGPETVADCLTQIERITDPDEPIWIDMEGKLRDAEDRFDLTRVRAVLEATAGFLQVTA